MFSVIIPTIGRYTLERTLRSIRLSSDDEVIVISDGKRPIAKAICKEIRPQMPYKLRFIKGPRTENWGNEQRNLGIDKANGDWLMFIDDDDIFVPDAFIHVRQALTKRKPHIFRMLNHHFNRQILWRRKKIAIGNIGTPMLCVPNEIDFLGRWPEHKEYAGDAHFLGTLIKKWPKHSIVWCKDIIVICRPEL